MLNLTNTLRCTRDVLLTQKQSEKLADLLFKAKVVKVIAAVTGGFSSIGTLYYSLTHGGEVPLALPLLAYFNYEVWVVADNCQNALEDPIKGFNLALASCRSEEAFVRKMTKGAPLMSGICTRYARFQAAKRPPSLLSKVQKKVETCATQ